MSDAGPTSRFARLTGTFIPLLAALVVVLVAAPLAEEWPLVSAVLISSVVVAGVFAVHQSRALRRGVVVALAPALGLRWLAHTHGEAHESLVVVSHLAVGVYLLLLGWICVTTVLRRGQITRDTVLGAVCGYILIAYVFTFAYAALEDINPGSFRSDTALPERDGARIGHVTPELMYYSFVTLTTVGYGDIVPAGRVARSLAILEMLTGQLYLAAFVARLVGVMGATADVEDAVKCRGEGAETTQEKEPS